MIDTLAPAVRGLVGEGAAVQSLQSYLSIVPVAGSRNTYSGFLIFLFTLVAAVLTALLVHALAGRNLAEAPPGIADFPIPERSFNTAHLALRSRSVACSAG